MSKATLAEKDVGNWLLHVDGSSTYSSSLAGVVLTSLEGDELEFALRFDFITSNNEAEYDALRECIKLALNAGARNTVVYSDSQLEDIMKDYLHEINELRSMLKSFQLHRIPRTKNTKANYLARLVSSLADCNTRTITEGTLPAEEKEVARFTLLGGILYKHNFFSLPPMPIRRRGYNYPI
ncbi:UNVERIFIED_CONTAM: hypothetical protein Slati_1128200 [Sesamum latifolium]|uniref:RNase H type-1 domain-containing protein n=1 Tax=Sesamum latifolium TaxID=2727402 RepID=A0AAW2XF32_9LAMI